MVDPSFGQQPHQFIYQMGAAFGNAGYDDWFATVFSGYARYRSEHNQQQRTDALQAGQLLFHAVTQLSSVS